MRVREREDGEGVALTAGGSSFFATSGSSSESLSSESETECKHMEISMYNLGDHLSSTANNLLKFILRLISPVNHTRSPQGFLQVQISHKLNTMQNMHIT